MVPSRRDPALRLNPAGGFFLGWNMDAIENHKGTGNLQTIAERVANELAGGHTQFTDSKDHQGSIWASPWRRSVGISGDVFLMLVVHGL